MDLSIGSRRFRKSWRHRSFARTCAPIDRRCPTTTPLPVRSRSPHSRDRFGICAPRCRSDQAATRNRFPAGRPRRWQETETIVPTTATIASRKPCTLDLTVTVLTLHHKVPCPCSYRQHEVPRWQGRSVFAFTLPADLATQTFARTLRVDWAGTNTTPLLLRAVIFGKLRL